MIAYRSAVVQAPLRVHGLCTVWPLAQPALSSPSAWRISRPRRDTFSLVSLEAGLLALPRRACRTIKQADLVIRVVVRHRARGSRGRREVGSGGHGGNGALCLRGLGGCARRLR